MAIFSICSAIWASSHDSVSLGVVGQELTRCPREFRSCGSKLKTIEAITLAISALSRRLNSINSKVPSISQTKLYVWLGKVVWCVNSCLNWCVSGEPIHHQRISGDSHLFQGYFMCKRALTPGPQNVVLDVTILSQAASILGVQLYPL